MIKRILAILTPFFIFATPVHAASAASRDSAASPHHLAFLFFAIAGILVAAKVLHLIEKIKLPPVVGELLAGILLGNLALIGIPFFKNFQTNEILTFLAELGVILLLFQTGLESNVSQLLKVGKTALIVALIGAFVPFLLASFVVGPLLLPGQPSATYLFLGAALAATSVGITARIFKDLGKMKTKAAQIVLGAAVIDDILGLVILAVISSLVVEGVVTPLNVGFIVLKSFLFLVLSVVIGQLIAPMMSRLFAMIHTGIGTKFTLAISFGLVFAGIAELIGLEPIIGAFAAGLVLDPVHFKSFREPELVEEMKQHIAEFSQAKKEELTKILSHHSEKSVTDIIEPLVFFFVPLFLVMVGMSVNLNELISVQTILLASVMTIVAVVGKLVAGLPTQKGSRLTIGLAMVPRGEVGLIFAAIGQSLGVISPQIFSVIVLTVLLTTIVGPFLLNQNLQKNT